MDRDEVLEVLRQRHWAGLARMAAESGSDSVGLSSAGRRLVSVHIERLARMGIEAWAEKVEGWPDSAPTWNLKIRVADLPRLVDSDWGDRMLFSSLRDVDPEIAEAARQDAAEYELQTRTERPWVQIWFGDSPDGAFEAALRERMTFEQASALRNWVVENGPTWRAIASHAREQFSESWRLGWIPGGHQQVGLEIVSIAAAMFDEKPGSAPWY